MRMLFSCPPAFGEFHPLTALALVAQARGHTIAFASGENLRPYVEQLGFEFLPIGLSSAETRATVQRRLPEVFALPPQERQMYMYPHGFAGLWVETRLADLLAAATAWQPDVIVRDLLQFSAALVAEKLRVPHATAMVQAIGQSVKVRSAIAAPLDAWRGRLDLPSDPGLAMLDRYLTLVPFPQSFDTYADDVPPTVHYTQPLVHRHT